MTSLPQPPSETCYRHADRETGRHCSRCGRPACSDCLVQASVGSQCRDCAKAGQPSTSVRVRRWTASKPTLVTYAIIAINVAVFLWMVISDSKALGSQLTEGQFDLGLNKRLLNYNHEWYRLVTSGFIHFGVLHILMNMFLLFQLGQMLEPMLDRVRFGLLYFACLLGGSLGVLILDGNGLSITGGASGAVFGLMTAAAIGLHRRGVNIFSTGLGTVLLLNIVLTFSIAGISKGGHLGGIAAGAVCALGMLAPSWKAPPKWVTYATPVAVAVFSVIASVIVTGTAASLGR